LGQWGERGQNASPVVAGQIGLAQGTPMIASPRHICKPRNIRCWYEADELGGSL